MNHRVRARLLSIVVNWLAHLQLSDPAPASQIGALLPDLIKAPQIAGISPIFLPGIKEHHLIDSFTDGHPVFARSRARISGPLRRYAGVVVDVFYDHFLASRWSSYSAIPLPTLIGGFYDSIETHGGLLPDEARLRFCQMREGRWLESYDTVEGVSVALDRIGRRFKRQVDLDGAVEELRAQYDGFASDFATFYPELALHVSNHRGK